MTFITYRRRSHDVFTVLASVRLKSANGPPKSSPGRRPVPSGPKETAFATTVGEWTDHRNDGPAIDLFQHKVAREIIEEISASEALIEAIRRSTCTDVLSLISAVGKAVSASQIHSARFYVHDALSARPSGLMQADRLSPPSSNTTLPRLPA